MKTFRDVYGNEYGSRYIGSIDCPYFGLTSLEGAPVYVSGDFICHTNDIQTLRGAPKYVGGDFFCDNNNNLKSLRGAPIYVGGAFVCEFCDKLKSLEGAPKYIGGDFDYGDSLLHGEIQYNIISSLIRGRYNRYIKEGEEFQKHILQQLEKYFTA